MGRLTGTFFIAGERFRLAIIDTSATIIFFTIIAAFVELFIGGMSFSEVLATRLIMIPMMIITGRPYGIWRNWFFRLTKPTVPWSRIIIDGLAFLSMQLPIYAATLLYVGVEINQVFSLLGSTALLMALVSRPFGLFLEAMRRWFRVI